MEEILLPNEGGFREVQTYQKNPIPIYVEVSTFYLLTHCTVLLWVSISLLVKFPPAKLNMPK